MVMGPPKESRDADDLVEPLYAGLSDAGKRGLDAASAADADSGPSDPWKHPRRAQIPDVPAEGGDENEVRIFPLVLKALLLLIVLGALSAFVYLTIGV